MSEANKAAVRRGFEIGMNERRMELFDDLLHSDYVNHSLPAPVPGPEGFRQVIGMFLAAFPDFRVELRDVLGDGDLVSTHGIFTGTHQGEFMGIPPTGKRIEVEYIDIWRFEEGRGKENWVQMDMLGMMRQLGVIPA